MKKSFSLLLSGALVVNLFCFASINVKAADDTCTLKATIRDFDPVNSNRPELNHPDFENPDYFTTSTTGAVQSTLGEDNTPVYSSSGYSVKIITSKESFYDWYHDTSKNMNISYDLVLDKSGDNYVFDSSLTDGFFPINDQGFGNYYQDKNFHFTLELHSKFTYKQGQVFSIAGDDDVWLFIDRKLVGDLGGIHQTLTEDINLDDLGLVSGEEYSLDLFYAERHIEQSNLKITTNIELANNNDAPIADAGDNQTKETEGTTANVDLDASKSMDPNGDKLTYTWKDKSGEIIAKGATPNIDLAVGKHTLTLTVSDGSLTDTDTVEITVVKRQSTPTIIPTMTPTIMPTLKPTAVPTSTSTPVPTEKPTPVSTEKPTPVSTEKPTPVPTEKPTPVSTEKPTSLPTDKPTPKPTVTSIQTPEQTEKPETNPTPKKTNSIPNITTTDKRSNRKPVADAGIDQLILTADETALAKLDGSKSYDPDGDTLTYIWKNQSNTTIGNGEIPSVKLPVGDNKITLTVSDGKESSTDTVNIKVQKQEIPNIRGSLPDIAVSLISDIKKVEEDKEFALTMKYVNKTEIKVPDVYLELELPQVQVIDKAGGEVTENKISWEVGELDAGEKGEITLKVKSNLIEKAEIIKNFTSTILSRKSELSNTYDDTSKLGVLIYSKRLEHSHTRYILGYPDKEFKGARYITRAETAVIFSRILNLKDLKITVAKQFVDVKPDFWAQAHIYAAIQAGLFKGVDSTHFNPDAPIKRAELATVIANYLGISRPSEQKPFESIFSDVEDNWAQSNIEEVARYKVVKGYEDGAFRPQNYITRQEAVIMINRMLYRGPLTNVTSSFPDVSSTHWAFGDIEESVRSHSFDMADDGTEVMTKYIDEPIW